MNDKEETELCRRSREGDPQALKELVEEYKPVVRRIAVHSANGKPRGTVDDFESAGNCGLLKAINQCDLNKGKLRPYAITCISREIRNSDAYTNGLSRSQRKDYWACVRANDELMPILGRKPTELEIAQRARLPLKKVTDALKAWACAHAAQPPEENPGSFSGNGAHPEDQLVHAIETKRRMRWIERTIMSKEFSETERVIFGLYYYGEMTDREIAELLPSRKNGVTKMDSRKNSVTKTRIRTLRKLKNIRMTDEDSDHGF